MTNAEIEKALMVAIRSCLQASGKEIGTFTPDTVPLAELDGFDSLCAIEALVELEASCGIEAESEVFLDGHGADARKRTIKEIAAAINHQS